MNTSVLVVIGVGGIGMAIARREGAGKSILLADVNENALNDAVKSLEVTGYNVSSKHVDVSVRQSVHKLATSAAELGNVMQVVNTAGLSPNMASPEKILAVDLLGTALIFEEFGKVVAFGGAGIVISSMAGYMFPPFGQEMDEALARTPSDELLNLSYLQSSSVVNSGVAYGISKRANHLRVQAESLNCGERGARIN